LFSLGLHFIQEFAIESARFDFALPSIRLLFEIDSKKFHKTARQISNDKRKNALAKMHGWNLVRVKPGMDIDETIRANVILHENYVNKLD
jgi:very-short-patch-repair endonuclease